MIRSLTAVLGIALLSVGCNGSREPAGRQPSVELARFSQDDGAFAVNSGFADAVNLVIRDSSAWSRAWATLHAGLNPQPPLPAVDFSTDMVVLVAIGEQPNGGHSVRIASLRPDAAGGLLVSALHSAAGPGCMVPQVITSPADVARVRASDAEIRFVVDLATRDCVES